MPDKLKRTLLLGGILLLWPFPSLHASEDSFSTPLIRPGVHAGQGRTPFYQDFYVPLQSYDDKVYFLNFKNVFGNRGDSEQNIGLAYRALSSSEDTIWGINAFYDTRFTENNNYLRQVGFGIERLSDPIDLRANLYLPLTDKKLLGESQSFSFGSTNIIRTTSRSYEEPLPGFDFELAYLIPKVSDFIETRLRIGGYYYDSDLTKDILGYRVALEARPSKALTLEIEVKDDRTIEPSLFVGAYVTLPFDLGKLLHGKNPFEGTLDYLKWNKGKRPLRQRMSDVIIRDIDIVAKDQSTNTQETQVPKLIYVNNTNSSGVEDGTKEHPYNTLAEGISASTTNGDWIYVAYGNGTATGYTGNYTLNANSTLWGEGYQAFPGLGGGNYPLIKATGASGIIVTAAQNNVIQGLRLQDAYYGVNAQDFNTITVQNNIISGMTSPDGSTDASGIFISSSTGSHAGIIRNNQISDTNIGVGTDTYSLALFAFGGNLSLTVSGNTLSDSESRAMNAGSVGGNFSGLFTRNIIQNNNSGVLALNLGGTCVMDFGGGALGSPGYNSFINNPGADIAALDTAVKAENNYWGGGAGSFASLGTGTVDGSPFLTSNPN